MIIAAFLGAQTLGDFVMNQVVAASVARAFPQGRLLVVYRDDRPYKNLVTLMNPFVTKTLKLPADPNVIFPLDWFDGERDVPDRPFAEDWYEGGYHRPDIFLTSSMLEIGRCLPPPPGFRMPPALAEPLGRALRERGLDEKTWFVTMHLREPGYRWRRGLDSARNVDPATYIPAIRKIIEEHGGQVVRLGDPSMTPLPAMDGLIDLSRQADTFAEQAFAISRSRYFLGTDTGPTQLASALKVPTATTNACGIGVWNDGDVVLTKRFTLPSGRAVAVADLIEMGTLTMHTIYPATVKPVDNTPDQLSAVADHMFAKTADCTGWREDAGEGAVAGAVEPLASLTLPLTWRDITEFADLTFLP